ncbi:Error-prone DNA polymerase [Alphaproteobacteria bacterium SO-S41]|nr:Error-prone DNA polymerase [Alphaproteobacteria bacterium SO-S41]
MTTPAYAELQVTSNFSFLRGASHARELVERAAELKLSAIAITDTNTLAGIVRGHVAALGAGLRFIVGARLDFTCGAPSVLCFPKDRSAYGRLARMISRGQLRRKKGECQLTYDDLQADGEGQILVVLPPATLTDAFEDWLKRLRGDFRKNVYLAASRLYGANDAKRLHRLAALARRMRTPLVATGDVLYHEARRRPLQDVLTCIREKCTIAEAGLRLEANAERHLKAPDEMARLFAAHPEAIANTMEIVRQCRFSLLELQYEYPDEPVPPGKTPDQHLADLTWSGAATRYHPYRIPQIVQSALYKELAFIADQKIAKYFLTVHDIVRFARGRNILCQGRGSAANSAVCFCLGVTAVDPTETKLLFERFMSKERNEPPDIDVDFEHERREEVIQYIYERYGRDRAAICATVIHYRSRSAIRDVGKALGLTEDVTAALADTVWGSWNDALPEAHVKQAGFDPENIEIARAVDLARELLNFPRHLSQHVGGFVLTKYRLDETVPIGHAAMDNRTFIEWDKDDIDELGLMKVDVLALGMLSCLRRGFHLANQHHGLNLKDVADIKGADKAVYDMLSKGDSLGVFQVESRAQMSMLPRLRPQKFYDLVIEVAIVRPGPIQGNMVHPYLKRRENPELISYPKPAPEHGPANELEEILGRTKGVPLFQEQAMAIALTAAKFTPEEANGLRRAMATFRHVGTIHTYENLFVSSLIRRGYDPDFARKCFEQIRGFGSYGFPESHAASFAKLVYASAWIKCHYPDVFCAAILNSQPMGFYQPAQLVRDAREHGVEVRAPDVFASDWDCTLEEPSKEGKWKAVRLGLRLIRGLHEEDAKRLLEAREAGARTLEDLAHWPKIDRGVLERIADADAYRSVALDRRAALWRASGLKDRRNLATEAPLLAPLGATAEDDVSLPAIRTAEHVAEDYRTTQLSLKKHPCAFFRGGLTKRRAVLAQDLSRQRSGRRVVTAGLVLNRQRPQTAKNVMFATLEDESGVANLVIWDAIFQANRKVLMTGSFLLVRGEVQTASNVTHVIVREVEDLTHLLSRLREGTAAANVHKPERLQASRDFH